MNTGLNWAPQACTLPTAQQPLRMAEFAGLFADSAPQTTRMTPTWLRLRLAAAVWDRTIALVEAESSCCTFFSFTIGDVVDDAFDVDIEVPATHVEILDGLADQATHTS